MKLKTFLCGQKALDKWLHQNKAVETGEVIEGCLLDSFLVKLKRGWAAIYEHYLNPWQSNYLVEYQTGDATEVLSRWGQAVAKSENI